MAAPCRFSPSHSRLFFSPQPLLTLSTTPPLLSSLFHCFSPSLLLFSSSSIADNRNVNAVVSESKEAIAFFNKNSNLVEETMSESKEAIAFFNKNSNLVEETMSEAAKLLRFFNGQPFKWGASIWVFLSVATPIASGLLLYKFWKEPRGAEEKKIAGKKSEEAASTNEKNEKTEAIGNEENN